MLIYPSALKSLISIKKIQPKLMVANFNGNPSTTIICFSSTNASDKTDLDTFYNELTSPVRCIFKHDVLLIGGDMNVQIGKNIKKIQLT